MAGSSSIPLTFCLILFSVDTHTPELLISSVRQPWNHRVCYSFWNTSGKFTTDLLFSVDTHTPELLISSVRQPWNHRVCYSFWNTSGKFTTDLD